MKGGACPHKKMTSAAETLQAHGLDVNSVYTRVRHAFERPGVDEAAAIAEIWDATAAQRAACVIELHGQVDGPLLNDYNELVERQTDLMGRFGLGGAPMRAAYIIVARVIEAALFDDTYAPYHPPATPYQPPRRYIVHNFMVNPHPLQ